MPEPHLRASDADRSAVAEVLGDHMSAGRLTVAEYDERLARTYASRTYGELAELTADLPAEPRMSPAPADSGAHAAPRPVAWAGRPWVHGWGARCQPGGGSLRAVWSSWLSTALIVLTIWAATSLASGGWIYPWPIWVIGPWGAVLLVQTITGHQGAPAGRGRARNRDRHRGR